MGCTCPQLPHQIYTEETTGFPKAWLWCPEILDHFINKFPSPSQRPPSSKGFPGLRADPFTCCQVSLFEKDSTFSLPFPVGDNRQVTMLDPRKPSQGDGAGILARRHVLERAGIPVPLTPIEGTLAVKDPTSDRPPPPSWICHFLACLGVESQEDGHTSGLSLIGLS